jgi:hypothetical protein
MSNLRKLIKESIENQMPKKLLVIKEVHHNRITYWIGTLIQLINAFSYTIEAGAEYDGRINENPKSGKALERALNLAVDELQSGSYDPDSFILVPVTDKAKELYANNNYEITDTKEI